MGELLRKNVRERYRDLMDWVDIRPDINMAWSLWFVVLIAVCASYVPASFFLLATVLAVAAALAIVAGGVILALAAVMVSALYDSLGALSENIRASHPRPTTSLRVLGAKR